MDGLWVTNVWIVICWLLWWLSNLGLNSCLKSQANVGTKTVTILTWAPTAVSELDASNCLRSMGTRKKQSSHHPTRTHFTVLQHGSGNMHFNAKKSLLKIAPSPSLAKAIRRTGTVWTRIHLAQVNWSPQKNQWLSFGKFSLGPPQPLRSFAVPPAVKNSKMIDWYGTIETTDQHKWHDPHFIQLPSWNHEMWNFIISNYASQYS